jgi:hypothetical protein
MKVMVANRGVRVTLAGDDMTATARGPARDARAQLLDLTGYSTDRPGVKRPRLSQIKHDIVTNFVTVRSGNMLRQVNALR